MRNVTKKFIMKILPIIAFICIVNVFSVQDAKAMEAIGENGTWEGEVDGERYVSYQASVSGFYDVSLDSENAENDIYAEFYDENDEYITIVFREMVRTAVRLEAGKEYYIKLSCEDEETYAVKDTLTFSISYHELEIMPVTDTKQTVTIYESVNVFEFNPEEDGIYRFECKPIGGSSIYYDLKLYAVDGEKEELIEERGSGDSREDCEVRFYLEGGQEYHLEYCVEPVWGNTIPESGVPAAVQLKKNSNISGIEVVEIPDIDYYAYDESMFATIELNILYEDGTKELISAEEIDEGSMSLNGISWKRKDATSEDVGEHEIEITYLGKYKTSGVLTVFKKSYYELANKTIYDGEAVTITDEYVYYEMYRFTPDSTGIYTFWTYNNQSFDDVWGSYSLLLYDEKDNEVEWVDGMGYKVKAGEKYCLVLYLDDRQSGISSFKLSIAKSKKHVCSYGEWETVKQPTYDEYGLKRRVCSVCDGVEEVKVDKLVRPAPITSVEDTSSKKPGVDAPKVDTKVKAPGKVKLSKLKKVKKNKIKITYKKVKDAKGYQIQYATNAKMKKAKSVTTSKTNYTSKKLKKGKTYYVRVQAYKMDGSKKVYGKWSTVKKIKL